MQAPQEPHSQVSWVQVGGGGAQSAGQLADPSPLSQMPFPQTGPGGGGGGGAGQSAGQLPWVSGSSQAPLPQTGPGGGAATSIDVFGPEAKAPESS